MSRPRLQTQFFILWILYLPCMTVAQDHAMPKLRVMSFNIRYGTANDGENRWEKRKQTVIRCIKESNPDIIGTQETLKLQAEYLQQQLSNYRYVGRSRQLDPNKGEQCGMLYRRDRFDELGRGHFWLSESPDQPGSKSWDSSLPRMASWLQLYDRQSKRSLYLINTHFDHVGEKARFESARLIRRFIRELPMDPGPVIVTGDFNAAEGSPPYRALFENPEPADESLSLQDTYRLHHPERTDQEGTFGGFQGRRAGARIDWIACSSGFRVLEAGIIHESYSGRFPSDHYPVFAQLGFESTSDR